VVKPLQLDKAGDTVPDPHVWGDVENIAMVDAIRDALIQLSPEDRSNSRRMQHDSHRVEAAGCLDYPADSNYT